MTQLTKEDIERIAKLACIALDKEDYQKLATQVGSTISWIEQLSKANTDGVEPLISIHEDSISLMPDAILDGNIVDDILRNTKNAKYNYFSVPKVIE